MAFELLTVSIHQATESTADALPFVSRHSIVMGGFRSPLF